MADVRNKRFIDMTGKKYGKLTVISEHGKTPQGAITWLCECKCGNFSVASGANLRKGTTNSCGCLNFSHEINLKHGLSNTTEYRIWAGIKTRCLNPNCREYYRYGGRGIRVCGRWKNSVENFYADMGARPSMEYSIDRINNDANYSCGHCEECKANGWTANCRWALRIEQGNNTRTNKFVVHDGEEMTIMEMARKTGIPFHRLYKKFSKERKRDAGKI